MRKRVKAKVGDTLIEVTMAIGIFSMVAVAVVSVVNSSTSGAQSALETTLTREEIDSQAEALRFIQSSYISTRNTESSSTEKYAKLWQAIINQAQDVNSGEDIATFRPDTCDELYDTTRFANQKAFIINVNNLSSDNINDIIFTAENSDVLSPASTYPHVMYTDKEDTLLEQGTDTIISHAEGIYIIAVKDPRSTTIVTDNSLSGISQKTAYYDFYIRTCWHTSGSKSPSTISTVIRLYDPAVINND